MFRTADNARFWDRIARKYASDPISDMGGYERTLERVRHYLRPGDRVLEFGCGTGTTALKLAPSLENLLATDISSEMIAIAREKARSEGIRNVTFEVAAPESADWPAESFDAVLGFNVLHLLEDSGRALGNIRHALKPGGLLLTKTPCLKDMNPVFRVVVPLMQMVGKAPHVDFLSAAEVEKLLKRAGFEVIECAYHASSGRDARPFIVGRRP